MISIISNISSTISGAFHLFKASWPLSAKDENENVAQTDQPEVQLKKRYLAMFIMTSLKMTLVKNIMSVDFVPRKSEQSGV